MQLLNQVVARNTRVASRTWPGESIVYVADDNTIHSLNETASVIWGFLDRTPTVEQIIKHVAEHFEVDEAQVTGDVIAFVETLVARGLVTVHDGFEEEEP
jgi:hypothetical protein